MSLANRIRTRMSDLGLTQEALAHQADISQGMVYKLISGKTKNTSKIVQLAHALECDIEWLATGKSKQFERMNEDSADYKTSNTNNVDRIKKLLKTLPAKDQKKIAVYIMDKLIGTK